MSVNAQSSFARLILILGNALIATNETVKITVRRNNYAAWEGQSMARLIRLREVMNRIPYSRATLYRKIAEGKFPKPIPMDADGRAVAFVESDVEAWIAERVGDRGNATTVAA